MKKKPGMTDAEWKAYRARVARRAIAAKLAAEKPEATIEEEPVVEEPEIMVQVGVMTAQVEAGPDMKLGTKDDDIEITLTKDMSRSELLKLATQRGIEVSHKASKKDILALLS
jgi:hypothetical protein